MTIDTQEFFIPFDPNTAALRVQAQLHSTRVAFALSYWNDLRGARRFPRRADIDPCALKSILPHLIIAQVSYEPLRIFYRLVGTEIVNWSKCDFTNSYADELHFQDDDRDWTDFYRIVIDAGQPAFGLTYWIEHGRKSHWIEHMIFPLSDDGQVITQCLAVEDYEELTVADHQALPPVTRRVQK